MIRSILLLILLAVPSWAQSPSSPIEPLPGPLVLFGGGAMPDEVRSAFLELAGRDKAKLVVVPTADPQSDMALPEKQWLDEWNQNGAKATISLLHAKTQKQADDTAFVKPLTEATAVWFCDGDPARLISRYRGTAFEKELHKLHRRGGVIGGASLASGFPGNGNGEAQNRNPSAKESTGSQFLPGFVVESHYLKRNRKARLIGLLDRQAGSVGLGIDEGTAAIVTGRTIRAVGSSTVTVILSPGANRPRGETTLNHGKIADLMQLRRAAANRAAAKPFPPRVVAEPRVPKGNLVIVGGGGLPAEITNRFFELAGGKDALLVVIPTAQEDPQVADHPEEKLFRRLGATNVKTLHTRNRSEANDPEFSKVLLDAKAVWFGGGRHWRFADSYEGTLTEERFHGVLARGGIIGGSSAGASIQAEFMPRGHPLGNTIVDAEGYERGFGFLPGVAVDQHFFARRRTKDMTGLMTQFPQYLGIGIDEATAIVVHESRAEVIGKSKVAFYDYKKGKPKGERDYVEVPSGESYDLKTRQKQ
ncbi:MAG: cyanophycinase [Gemmataceae bacterium]